MNKYIFTGLLTLSFSSFVLAEQQPQGPDVEISPDKIKSKGVIIEEGVKNGIPYIMVKPEKGPPYYLIDSDRDGDWDAKRNELSPNLLVPSWVIFEW